MCREEKEKEREKERVLNSNGKEAVTEERQI
jgi:hypothetical protein